MKTPVYKLLFVIACLLSVCTSCAVREQVEECTQYALTVKAVDNQGNDLTGSSVLTSVDIYLFDETGFVRRVPTGSSVDFLFAHYPTAKLTLVAWGNLKADSLQLPDIAVGTPIEQAQLSLLRNTDGYNQPITDLFYGRQTVETFQASSNTRELVEESMTLVLQRRAASMSIRTHRLATLAGEGGEPCRLVVRGTTNSLNFLAEPVNSDAGYVPSTVTDGKGDLYAMPFRIFPTQEQEQRQRQQPTEIDIFQGSRKLCTISTDNQGRTLYALPGQQLHVDIAFAATIQVTVTVVPWGEVWQETEM